MAIIALLVFFMALTSAITYFGYRVYSRPGRVQERLAEEGTISTAEPAGDGEMLVRIIQQVGGVVPVSPAEVTESRRYLIAAGFRSDQGVTVLYGCKVIMSALLLIAVLHRSLSLADVIAHTVERLGDRLLARHHV